MATQNTARRRARGLPNELARAENRIVRPRDFGDLYRNAGADFARLADAGLLVRVAHGYYAIVPEGERGRRWRPPIEAIALGIAVADYGYDDAALMGITAARLLGVVPRALNTAVVAVPRQRPVVETDFGRVHFVKRAIHTLQVQHAQTLLADGYTTTAEQTVLDLVARPTLGGITAGHDTRSGLGTLATLRSRRRSRARAPAAQGQGLAPTARARPSRRPRDVISRAELAEWAERFGVAAEQIQRDHLISHVLAALSNEADAGTMFYGGTALCRSYLDGTRLSEDVDLLHPEPAKRLMTLAKLLPQALRREFPDLEWTEGGGRAGAAAAYLGLAGLTPIKLEIDRFGPDERQWTFMPTEFSLRYADAPSTATLWSPDLATFAAMKMLAWYDRHAPRDLFDLAGLSDLGALTEDSEQLLRSAAGYRFLEVEFTTIPGSVAAVVEDRARRAGRRPSDSRRVHGTRAPRHRGPPLVALVEPVFTPRATLARLRPRGSQPGSPRSASPSRLIQVGRPRALLPLPYGSRVRAR